MTTMQQPAWLAGIGAVAVAAGSFGVGDLPRADDGLAHLSLAWLTYGHGKSLSGLVFWVGVAAMVWAWVWIARIIVATRDCSVDIRTAHTRILRISVVCQTIPLLLCAPVFSRDVYAYLGQGALLRDGFNPYSDGPAVSASSLVDSMAQVWATTTSPYSPLFVALSRGVTEISGDNPIAGVALMRVVMLPGWLLALWAVPHLAQRLGRDPRIGLWLSVANPMLAIHLLAGPHVEMLMAGVLATGVMLVVAGRHISGTAVVAIAVSIKITAGIAVPFLLWIWLAHKRRDGSVRPRDIGVILAWIIGLVLGIFAIFTAVVGHGLGWIDGLGYANRIINWLTIPSAAAHLVTLITAPFTPLALSPVLSVTRTIGSLVLAVTLVTVWWRFRENPTRAVTGMVVALAAVLVLEPSTLPWYYSWALFLAGAVAITARAMAVIAAASTYLLLVFQPDDSILLYDPMKTPLLLIPAIIVGAAIWRPRHRSAHTLAIGSS